MRPVQAGRLRKRIVIEQITGEEPNDLGQPVPVWGTLATRWASVDPVATSGREYLQAAALQSDVTHRVELRYLAAVTPKCRITWGSRTLEIMSVADVEERGRMTVLMCREVL